MIPEPLNQVFLQRTHVGASVEKGPQVLCVCVFVVMVMGQSIKGNFEIVLRASSKCSSAVHLSLALATFPAAVTSRFPSHSFLLLLAFQKVVWARI